MAEWKDIKDTAKRVARGTARKTEELAQSATLNLKLTAAKSKRDAAYEKLGKLTYKQLKSGESQAENIARTVSEIDRILADIDCYKAKIEAAKEEKARIKEIKKQEKKDAQKKADETCAENVKNIIDENAVEE